MQFFIRELAYSNSPTVPEALKNVIPVIGPLHISLNARECVLLQFYEVFAEHYAFRFGRKAKLAKKPKPWRVSLLLEVIYGGMDTSERNDFVGLEQVQRYRVPLTGKSS